MDTDVGIGVILGSCLEIQIHRLRYRAPETKNPCSFVFIRG